MGTEEIKLFPVAADHESRIGSHTRLIHTLLKEVLAIHVYICTYGRDYLYTGIGLLRGFVHR